MSILSTKCDNLCLMARLVREYDYSEISKSIRDAADTIWSLRNRLNDLIDENDDLQEENTKLRELIGEMFDTIATYNSCWDHRYTDTKSYSYIMYDLGISVNDRIPDNLDLVELRSL